MKKHKVLITILLFFFFGINNAISQDKVAYIDLDFVLKNSNLGKIILTQLEEINKKNISDLKSKENELSSIENEIKTKQNIISKDQFDEEIKVLKNKISNYRNYKNDLVSKFEKNKNEKLNNFFLEINPIIQNYMEKNSINILLDRKNVFIGKSNSDITKDIIELVDKL